MFASLFLKRPKLYCDGCGFSMAKVRNVWRDNGKDYCTRLCMEHHRIVQAAGVVSSSWYIGLAGLLIVFMLAFTFTGGSRAWAKEYPLHYQSPSGLFLCHGKKDHGCQLPTPRSANL